ncbi:MAG: hypothetical protein K2I29_06105, partial [Clostridia bacterium]|nr:hypothetical protein [Clostridia bacterium]
MQNRVISSIYGGELNLSPRGSGRKLLPKIGNNFAENDTPNIILGVPFSAFLAVFWVFLPFHENLKFKTPRNMLDFSHSGCYTINDFGTSNIILGVLFS